MIATVISDAGPLIGLARIQRLDLLQEIFEEVLIPAIVEEECCQDRSLPGARTIRDAIKRSEIGVVTLRTDPPALSFPASLGAGERAVIELAVEKGHSILMDDRLARAFAKRLEIPTVGTGGLLLAAKRRGVIDRIEPLLRELTSQGYRLSSDLVAGLLTRAGESSS